MSVSIPESALRRVARSFDEETVRRGVEHVLRDRVHIVKPPPWPVVARVHDAVVTVSGGLHALRGDCSCEIADCEHAAATALAILAAEPAAAARRAAAEREATVVGWLSELGRPETPADAAGDKAVAYVIDDRDGLALTVQQCTRLRGGVLGVGSVMNGDPRPWIGDDDLRRIALLRAVTRVAPQATRLRFDRLHGELLQELAASGRLYWKSTRTAALAWGETVRETLAWLPCDGPGELRRLGLASGLIVAPARACFYIDPDGALFGPLDTGVPAELVARLIVAPPVPASMRGAVERNLRPLLSPAAGAIYATGSARPVRPRLTASLDDAPATRNVVRLVAEAVYGDERFPLCVWDPARPLDRDLVAEARHRDRLRSYTERLPFGEAAASSLELLADARFIAETMVPGLRAEGWTCVLAENFPHDAPREDVEWVERLRPMGERGMFALELGVTVAGRTVPLLPILLAAIKDGKLVVADGEATVLSGLNLRLDDGELVHVPEERLRRWLRPLVELSLRGLDAGGDLLLPPLIAAAVELPALDLGAARARLEALLALEPREEPAGFGGTLRPYQRVGLAWLHALHDAGCGGVLADEMGLGKTVQLLAFLDGLRVAGKLQAALVVAPRSVVGNWEREAARFAPELRLTVTSYAMLVRDLERHRGVAWTTVIFDEAQALKNPETQLRAAAAALHAESRFCVTGTPIENHLGELWSQLDLVVPGLLGRRRAFDALFRRPIEKHGAVPPLQHLRQRIRPFLLRRTKTGVGLDLPPVTEVTERIELETAQRDLYEALRQSCDEKVHRALAAKGIQGASLVILDALLKLRQCCCDPRLLPPREGETAPGSAKLERLMTMLEELADSGRSTLVFSSFSSMLRLIAVECERAGISTEILTGDTRDRDAVVARFQEGKARVFLLSLKAGGVGLNLTRADTIVHYDPWWNPAAEAQATGRAHRIGQEQALTVYRLVARGTVEEVIGQMQEDKRQLTLAALQEGGATRLSAADLEELYRRLV